MSMAIQSDKDKVVIAVDPHKASWTAAAVDSSLQPLASVRVPVSRDGYQALRRFARQWPTAGWAIEGAAGLGAPLSTWLRTDGIEVIDVSGEAGRSGAGVTVMDQPSHQHRCRLPPLDTIIEIHQGSTPATLERQQ